MTMVFATWREGSSLLTQALVFVILLVAPFWAIYLVLALMQFACAMATSYLPRRLCGCRRQIQAGIDQNIRPTIAPIVDCWYNLGGTISTVNAVRQFARGGDRMTQFEGFPQDAITFFEEIAIFNAKEWFEENKTRFQENIQQPAQAFVEALGERLATLRPGIQYNTSLNGTGSIMRIYRDTRFSKDKTPYKTNLGLVWWEGPGKKMKEPGYYFHIDRAGAWIANGMYILPKEALATYRKAVDHERRGAALIEAIAHAEAAGLTISGSGEFTRVPTGYEKDHPRAGWLRRKGIVTVSPPLAPEAIHSPALVDHCFAYAKAMLPLHEWFVTMQQG